MAKILFISFFLIMLSIECSENSPSSFDYEKDTPLWLKSKIENLSSDQQYYGTMIFRYEWNKSYVYHIMIPISSCAYCELYNSRGNKILLTDNEMFQDFIKHKKNEILVWEWGN